MPVIDPVIRHTKQLSVMRGWLNGRRYYKASKALEMVRKLETGFRKDGKTPKFDHQLSVVQHIVTLESHLLYPEETITTGFLHDAIEDHAEMTIDFISNIYGKQVAQAVWCMSKKTKSGLTKSYEMYFAEMAEDAIASVNKPADRNHNMYTMQGVFSAEKQLAYTDEVSTYFMPMIKSARRNFPQQYPAYENLKITLLCQMNLVRAMLQPVG